MAKAGGRVRNWRDIGDPSRRQRARAEAYRQQPEQQAPPASLYPLTTTPTPPEPQGITGGVEGAKLPKAVPDIQVGRYGRSGREGFTTADRIVSYKPNYWEEPEKVVSWYNRVLADPETPLPEGMDKETLTGAYNYYKFRNQGKPPERWMYLNDADPFREFLTKLPTPGATFLRPDELKRYAPPPEAGAESEINPAAADFDWQRLTVEQKRSILNDPKFSITQVTAPGQQGLILSDIMYGQGGLGVPGKGTGWQKQGLQWWQPVAYSVLSNPKTNPVVQGAALTVMTGGKGLPIAIGMTLLGYGAQSEDKTVREISEALLGPFIWGAQTIEQAAGTLSYLTKGFIDKPVPVLERAGPGGLVSLYKFGKAFIESDRLSGFIENPQLRKAVWQASKSYYETLGDRESALHKVLSGLPEAQRRDTARVLNSILPLVRDENTVWVLGEAEPVPVQPGYTLNDAVQKVLDGASADEVLTEYQRVYGLSGVVSDFMYQSLGDPLNVLPDVAGGIRGRISETRAVKLEALGAAAIEYQVARAGIERIKADAYRRGGLGLSTVPIPGTEINLLASEPTRFFREQVRSGRFKPEWAQHMTSWERRIAGITPDGRIRELLPTAPKEAPIPRFVQHMSTLTPESKLYASAHGMKENVSLLLDWVQNEDQMLNVMKSLGRADMKAVREMGAEFLNNPEMYTNVGAFRDFTPKIEQAVADYKLAARNRDLFWQVVEALNDDPTNILKNFTDGDPKPDFERLKTRLTALNTPEARALLNRINTGEFTPEFLSEQFKVFNNGVPTTYQEFKALVSNRFYEHMGKWGVKHFGVKKVTQVEEVFRMLKGAQSLTLLDFNTSFLANNFINNRVRMMSVGVFGFTSEGRITKFFENDFGIVPAKLKEGFGPTGEAVVTKGGEKIMTAEQVAQAARRGKGVATAGADTISAIRRVIGVGTKWSAKIESNSSMQVYYKAVRSFMGSHWRAGVGFDKMPAALETALRDYGIDPDSYYRNIEGALSAKDFEKLKRGATTRSVQSFIQGAAERLGKRPEDISRMLGELGVLDELRERAEQAKTPEQLRRAFDDIERKALDANDVRIAGEVRNRAEFVAQKVSAEKAAGAVSIFQELTLDFFDRKVDNDRIWDDAYLRAEQTDSRALRNSILSRASQDSSVAWKRFQAYDAATIKGLIEGLGLDGEFEQRFLSRRLDQHQALRTFFEEKHKDYQRFFNTTFDNPETRRVTYETLEWEYNRKYAEAASRIQVWDAELDNLFASEFGRNFGPQGEAMARAWRESIRTLSAQMDEAVIAFRDTLRGKTQVERAEMWGRFKPEYQRMYAERAKANLDGIAKLYRWDENPDLLTQMGEQQRTAVEQAAVGAAGEVENVWGVAARHNFFGLDAEGQPVRGAPQHLVRAVRKYLGAEAEGVTRPEHLTAGLVDKALTIRDQIIAAEGAVPKGVPAAAARFDELDQTIDKALAAKTENTRLKKLLAMQKDLTKLWETLPEDVNPQIIDRLAVLQERWGKEVSRLTDLQKIGEAYMRAESALRGMEERGDMLTTREHFRDALVLLKENLTPEQVDLVIAITDARAEAWARVTGRTAEDWYATRLKKVVRGGEGELFQEGRIQPISRGLSPEEMQNYARALIRAGEDELRRAIEGERNLPDRIALLDAAHDLNPEMAERVALKTKELLFQDSRGAVSFADDGSAIIHAFEQADVSTMAHEIGHVFLEDYRRSADEAAPQFRQQIMDDVATLEDWAGVKQGNWTRKSKEKFARGFERYMADGKAPTPKLAHVFEQFKVWILEIYRTITGSHIDIKITRKVREVFDRMLTEQAATELPLEAGAVLEMPPSLPSRSGWDFFTRQISMDEIRNRVATNQRPGPEFQPNLPLYPPGGFDQTSGYMDMGRVFHDGWTQEVRPVLDAMREEAAKPSADYSFAGMDAGTSRDLNSYLTRVRSQNETMKHAAVRWGDASRNYALLDYQMQYGFDKLLSAGVPYEFFATRSLNNWMSTVMDRPAWISHFLRWRNLGNTYESELPERLRGKIFIPMPFLPKEMGSGIFIDPTFQTFPFRQFLQPLEAYARDQQSLANNAAYVLREWGEGGTMTPERAQTAIAAQSGADWERAVEQAKLDQGENASTGADYFAMLFSPALYLTLPYYFATGKKSGKFGWPAGQLPVTRFGQGAEAAFKGTPLEWIGKAAGLLAKPEAFVREKLGLSEFGEWGDYYIDRQLANMAAEGVPVEQITLAMNERKGDLYDQAVQRVREELMLRVPGMAPLYGLSHGATLDKVVGALIPSLFPGGLLPPAEMQHKGLKKEYNLVWEAYQKGNKEAFNKFFEAHPEYEARLALRKDPQERLTQFLKSAIWDAYEALGPTDRKQAAAYLGTEFDDFLDSEPGREFSTEQLVTWARLLKAAVPETEQTQAIPAPEQQVQYFAPEATRITDAYLNERKEKFPNYYALQETYYSLPESERAAFLMRFPQLREYRQWKRVWYKRFPDLVPVFNNEVFQRIDTTNWPPMLLMTVQSYALTGERLPGGVSAILRQMWEQEGRPYDDFENWIENQVYPALKNQILEGVMQ